VSAKLDGERFLVYMKDGELYLINRKYEFSNIAQVDSVEEGLIDCELVDGIFHVFDMMLDRGVSIIELDYLARWKACQRCVDRLVQDGFTNFKVKDIYHVKDSERVEKLTKLPTDGLIYTPVKSPYKSGRDGNLLKYKEKHTIDLALYRNDGRRLYCAIRGVDTHCVGRVLNSPIDVDSTDEEKTIWECCLIKPGMWDIIKGRPDKNQSNDIKIYNWILEAINDNLTKEKLFNYVRQR
jgi:hypothetical protein